MKRLPRAVLFLVLLLSFTSLLSLTKLLSAEWLQALYLDESALRSFFLWKLFSYGLIVTQPTSLLLALLPLALFGIPVEGYLRPKRLLLLFLLGLLFGAAAFLLIFWGVEVRVAGGALHGGVALAAAALPLSLLGRLPAKESGSLPTWALSLLFLAAVGWSAQLLNQSAPLSALLYQLSATLPGLLLGFLWARQPADATL